MLSPSTSSDFEIHVSDMLTHKARSYPTEPQVKTIRDLPMVCLQGADDDDDDRLCPRLNHPTSPPSPCRAATTLRMITRCSIRPSPNT